MFEVITKEGVSEFDTLDKAMMFAKFQNEFVTIRGNGIEVVGIFGVDSIRDGVCPDGVKYDWDKSARIGRVKQEKIYETDD